MPRQAETSPSPNSDHRTKATDFEVNGNIDEVNGNVGNGPSGPAGRTSRRRPQPTQRKEQTRPQSAEHEFSVEDVVESPTPQKWMVSPGDTKAPADLEDWVRTLAEGNLRFLS